jgi:hypothetical protein
METDTMNKTVAMIEGLDEGTRDLMAFPLMGKVNGRIASVAMRMAGEQLRARPMGDIDAHNDMMAEFDAAAAGRAFLGTAGVDQGLSDQERLTKWIETKEWLVEQGFKPSALVETFRFMLTGSTEKHTSTDEQLEMMAKLSGMPVEAVRKAELSRKQREVGRTKETVIAAMQLVDDAYESRGMFDEPPKEFAELVQAAIQSAKRSAIKIANSTEEALGSLALLRVAEDWT